MMPPGDRVSGLGFGARALCSLVMQAGAEIQDLHDALFLSANAICFGLVTEEPENIICLRIFKPIFHAGCQAGREGGP